MSEIKALDKLREYVDKQREEYNNHNVSFVWQLGTIADRIEAELSEARETTRKKHQAECVYWQKELHKILDTINGRERFWGDCMDYPLPEATIPPSEIARRMLAERYMLLPVDANNEPIHVGDILERVDGRLNKQSVGCVCRFGFNDSSVWSARDFRHVKQRTLEDIVADAIQYGHNGITGDRIEGKVAEFCAEIRELGGDAK